MRLSARNQIPGTVTAIHSGEAIANIHIDAGGVPLVASITVEAVEQLGLAVGSEVTAVVKASDVIVAIADLPATSTPWATGTFRRSTRELHDRRGAASFSSRSEQWCFIASSAFAACSPTGSR
jgi:molybdopterin-binding protein